MPSAAHYAMQRLRLADGQTTVHLVTLSRASFEIRPVIFTERTRLLDWCQQESIPHAIVGGFFDREQDASLDGSWTRTGRGSLMIESGVPSLDYYNPDNQPSPDHVLQAGPLLVRDGQVVLSDTDPEGFSSHQDLFDFDITRGRYQRAAIGLTSREILLLAADGPGSHPDFPGNGDSIGLTLSELADTMRSLGAASALNLDGGGSTTLIHDGRLVNTPRGGEFDPAGPGNPILRGRPIHSAIAFQPR